MPVGTAADVDADDDADAGVVTVLVALVAAAAASAAARAFSAIASGILRRESTVRADSTTGWLPLLPM